MSVQDFSQNFTLKTTRMSGWVGFLVFFAFSSFIADFSSFTCGGAGVGLAVMMLVHPAALIVTRNNSETFSQSRLRCSKCSG